VSAERVGVGAKGEGCMTCVNSILQLDCGYSGSEWRHTVALCWVRWSLGGRRERERRI